jgi:prepilin-type N-terminal cleavage/methylation domain-containing protein
VPRRGFTLIELLVVIIIIAILVGIATILVIRQVGLAKDRAAEAEMRTFGMTAYQGMVQSLTAPQLQDLVAEQAKGGKTITYGDGLNSSQPKQVVAVMRPAGGTQEWQAALLVRPGRCTVVKATDDKGYTAAKTVDVASAAACRAGLGDAIDLVASDFNDRTGNPYNGAVSALASWVGNTLQMPTAGMLLSKNTAPGLTNGSLSADVKVGEGSNGAGIVFRGNQNPNGTLSGFVLQMDPGLPTNGRPSVVIRQWTNGTENGTPLMRVAVPAGVDVRNANNLRIELNGNTYTAYLNNQQVGTGTLPSGYSGTQYGARTWSNVPSSPNTIGGFQVTPNG